MIPDFNVISKYKYESEKLGGGSEGCVWGVRGESLLLNQQIKPEYPSCFDPIKREWGEGGEVFMCHPCFRRAASRKVPLPRCCCVMAHRKKKPNIFFKKLCFSALASNLWEQTASFGCMRLSRCPLPAPGGKAAAIDDEPPVSRRIEGHSACATSVSHPELPNNCSFFVVVHIQPMMDPNRSRFRAGEVVLRSVLHLSHLGFSPITHMEKLD